MSAPETDISRLLVVLPNWVGDVVMATPVLAALRGHFSKAHIAYLGRKYIRDIVAGCDWHDDTSDWPPSGSLRGLSALVRKLKSEKFDAALLFSNAFRAALTIHLAGIPRRIGYARDGRSAMLTHRLTPLRIAGEFQPTPLLPYYEALAEAVGCSVPDRRLRLGITADQERAGRELQAHYRLRPPTRYAVINPGAAFGASKCWLPERFAELCTRLPAELGLTPVLVGAPNEFPLLDEITRGLTPPPIACKNPGTSLGSLKVLIRDAALLICNDTGPRHYGAAFNIPTVTIFGPTHQQWTDTGSLHELKIQAQVPCGPCQLKTCPLDLRCMHAVTTDHVLTACRRLLGDARRSA
jgi:heptosyltransferase-2